MIRTENGEAQSEQSVTRIGFSSQKASECQRQSIACNVPSLFAPRFDPWAEGAGKGLTSKRERLCLYSRSLDLQLCGNRETT